jgi:RNA 2',3'-cyclic 3'-phosphodiesterase
MEQLRTFVAIELSDALKAALDQAQTQLKRAPAADVGRWVAPDSVHLTLKFLGDIAADRVAGIVQAAQAVCQSFSPFSITLADLGCFPNAQRPRVIWIGVGGDVEPLQRLQGAVEVALEKLGFAAERRPFQPHLTLARIREGAGLPELQELVQRMATTKVVVPAPMTVHEVSLMRSQLKPSGAQYTQLAAMCLRQ